MRRRSPPNEAPPRRNRAGYTAVTAPLLAFLLQMMIGFTGTGVDACIDLVPFF